MYIAFNFIFFLENKEQQFFYPIEYNTKHKAQICSEKRVMGKDNKYDKLVNRVPDSDKGQKHK